MSVVPAWYLKIVTDSRPRLPFCLLAGAALGKRICCGRARNERPTLPGTSRCPRSVREHAPGRCAAIPGCRKSRNERRANPEAECGVREISLRKIHTAMAEHRQCLADSQGLCGAGIAGNSNCGTLDKRVGSPGFSISLIGWDPETRKEADSMLARYNENPKE